MKISLVIPVYNSEKYLCECLDSVFRQDFDGFEVICVNDGSTDSSLEILHEYALKNKNLKVLSQENAGEGPSRKRGLQNTAGKYVYFMDNDDCMESCALQKMYENIERNASDIALVDFYLWDHVKNEKKEHNYIANAVKGRDLAVEDIVFRHYEIPKFVVGAVYAPWTKIFSKSFLDKYDDWYLPDKIYSSDCPWHVQSVLRAEKISLCPHFLISYRVSNPDSITNQTANTERLFDIFEICAKEFQFIDESGFTELYAADILQHQIWALYANYRKFQDAGIKEKFYQRAKYFLTSNRKLDGAVKTLTPPEKDVFSIFMGYDTSKESELAGELQEMRKRFEELVSRLNDERSQKEIFIKENTLLKSEIENLGNSVEILRNSWSYRIGRTITKTIAAPARLFGKNLW